MRYDTGKHTVYYQRFHIVWITKYRYKVLRGALRERVRAIIRQVCEELGVTIVSGMFKGRSSRKIQQEFPDIRKRYWGCRFWARGYFCTTSGNVTDDIILRYIESHADKPTGVSR